MSSDFAKIKHFNQETAYKAVLSPLAFHSQSLLCPGWTQSGAVRPAEGGVQTGGARGSFIHLSGGQEFPIHFLERRIT